MVYTDKRRLQQVILNI
jgi:signal transduction histidine kinase